MDEPERPLFSGVKDEIGSLGADLKEMATLRWQLARLELQAAVGLIKRLTIGLLIVGVIALTALPTLAVAAAQLLDDLEIRCWRWLLIVGSGLLIGGMAGGYLALRRFRRCFVGMQHSLEELREDLLWLKEWSGSAWSKADQDEAAEG